MGNSSSSGRAHHEDTVDFGHLSPQGVYTGARDWNQAIVTQLITDRRLAPFYRPLEDYDDSWDDDQILAAMKETQQSEGADGETTITRAESLYSSTSRTHHKRPSAALKEPVRHPEAAVYRGAVECPICFLYYPPNINRSRCCDQAICTECFVQIKRADPTTTHLVSEPASCPYCVQENFGVVYTPPSWRAGIGSEGLTPPTWSDVRGASSSESASKRRRKSFGADSPEVVTIDQIRPDWEAKLAAVRAAVARRANRRIIMRQVGDRLIPVGISSGRVHALPTEDTPEGGESGSGDRGSRRSRRRGQNNDLNQYVGLGGQDLEELMVMEAMRLSLLEHEEYERRQREEEEKKKREGEGGAQTAATGTSGAGSSSAVAGSAPTADASPATTQPTSTSSTDSSPNILTPDAPASPSSNNFAHRSSSSLSRNSGQLSPESNEGSWRRQRSPSPLSAIGTAMRSATSTVSAVASPNPDNGSSVNVASAGGAAPPPTSARNSVVGSNSPSSPALNNGTDATASPSLTTLVSHTPNGPQSEGAGTSCTVTPLAAGTPGSTSTHTIAGAQDHPADTDTDTDEDGAAAGAEAAPSPPLSDTTATAVPSPEITTRTPPRPVSMRTASFASSLASANEQGNSISTYDYLPSSPASSASSLAHKPLLDESPSLAPQSYGAVEDSNSVLGA